jgi:hypothetical protein
MGMRVNLVILFVAMAALVKSPPTVSACAAISFYQVPVVNADQSVIIIWDAATNTEHFIRKASFKSAGEELGFIVPTPSQPELEESRDEAFDYLHKLTAPEVKHRFKLECPGITCAASPMEAGASLSVEVLQQKEVAGYKAAVLKAGVASDLVTWLKENGYAYSEAMEEWAKPYIEKGWKFTALKLAKSADGKNDKNLTAGTLRISFKTDEPLFPYREPDSAKYAEQLGAKQRLLRIYFIAEARYEGWLTAKGIPSWTGNVVWANKIKAPDRLAILDLLKLPKTTEPADWWLTEFEDNWPYKKACWDLYFSRAYNQETVKRKPIVAQGKLPWPGDVTIFALAITLVGPPVVWRIRRGRSKRA